MSCWWECTTVAFLWWFASVVLHWEMSPVHMSKLHSISLCCFRAPVIHSTFQHSCVLRIRYWSDIIMCIYSGSHRKNVKVSFTHWLCNNCKNFLIDVTLIRMLLTALFTSLASQFQPISCPQPMYSNKSPPQHPCHPCHPWPSVFSASLLFSSPLSPSIYTPHHTHLHPI